MLGISQVVIEVYFLDHCTQDDFLLPQFLSLPAIFMLLMIMNLCASDRR